MYLSKLTLNMDDLQVRHDLGNPHNMHCTIMRAFPFPLPDDERVLFRVENTKPGEEMIVLVQSMELPDWQGVSNQFERYFLLDPNIRSLEKLSINVGDIFRFRMRVSISKRVKYKDSGDSKRISLFSEGDRTAWLHRKAKADGFSLDQASLLVREAPYRSFAIKNQKETHHAILNMVDVDGILRVEEKEKFLDVIKKGIGPAKGLGCGLISLSR